MAQRLAHSKCSILGFPLTTTVLTSAGGSKNTDAIDVSSSTGYATIVLVLAGSGTVAPQLDVSQEVSLDGTTWYTPVNSAGSAIGTVIANASASAWIATTFPLTRYIRFVLNPDVTSVATLYFICKEGA